MAESDVLVDTSAEALPPPLRGQANDEQMRFWRRNFVANCLDVTFFSLGLAFCSLTTIVPLFIRELGGSTWLIGLVPALVQTGWVLPPLFVAPYIGRLNRNLPYILWMTLGERVPWLVLALLTYWLASGNPGLVLAVSVVLLTVFGAAGGLTMPSWMDMVTSVTPLRMRGKLFGYSGALGGLMGIGGGLLAERALAGYRFPLNFAFCFLGAGICMFISYAALWAIREYPRREKAPALTVKQYMERLPALLRADRDFSLFLITRVLIVLGNMAVAFISVYAVEQHGLPESLAGRFTSWMLGTQVISTPVLGAIGDRYGHKPALQLGLLFNALAAALALVVSTPTGFGLVFALVGASSGSLFATTLNMVVEFARPAERVTYIGLHGTLIAPATLVAPLAGAWIADQAGYGTLFVTAAICSCLGLAILSFLIRDPRHRQEGNDSPRRHGDTEETN
jgi:MFS family permease